MRQRNCLIVAVFAVLLMTVVPVADTAADACVPAPAGLVSWWAADGDAKDSAGANEGALRGGATFAEGVAGEAFSFSAPGDFVEVPSHATLSLESLEAATFEGWFRSGGGSAQGDALVIAEHTCGSPNGWFFTTGQGCFIGDHFIGGYGVGGFVLDDNVFHHFACVKDGANYREYVDGVLISEGAGSQFGTPSMEPVQIGSITTGICSTDPNKHQLYGQVDELGVFHRPLSPEEIYDIFALGSRCLEVLVDIKPGSYPNSINLGSNGGVPVAVFSTAEFDASDIDPLSVSLSNAVVRMKNNGTTMSSLEDLNGDGLLDLVVHVETDALELSDTDIIAVLEGRTMGGTAVRGTDAIRVVP